MDFHIYILLLTFLAISCGQSEHKSGLSQIIGDDERFALNDSLLSSNIGALSLDGTPICTAFAIGPSKIMTANHCYFDKQESNPSLSRYSFSTAAGKVITLKAIEKSNQKADIITFNLDDSLDGISQGVLALNLSDSTIADSNWSGVIGFSSSYNGFVASSKGELTPFVNQEGKILPGLYFHTYDTLPGTSGAPIFDKGRVIAIHLGFIPAYEKNYAVAISSLDDDAQIQREFSSTKEDVSFKTASDAFNYLKTACLSSPRCAELVTPLAEKLAASGIGSMVTGMGTLLASKKFNVMLIAVNALNLPGMYPAKENSSATQKSGTLVFNSTVHIGDGNFGDTSACASSLKEVVLVGRASYIEFFVPNDEGQDVRVVFRGLCGIENKDFVRLYRISNAAELSLQEFDIGANIHTFKFDNISRGNYRINVESVTDSNKNYDDFMFTQIVVSSPNGEILPLQQHERTDIVNDITFFTGSKYSGKKIVIQRPTSLSNFEKVFNFNTPEYRDLDKKVKSLTVQTSNGQQTILACDDYNLKGTCRCINGTMDDLGDFDNKISSVQLNTGCDPAATTVEIKPDKSVIYSDREYTSAQVIAYTAGGLIVDAYKQQVKRDPTADEFKSALNLIQTSPNLTYDQLVSNVNSTSNTAAISQCQAEPKIGFTATLMTRQSYFFTAPDGDKNLRTHPGFDDRWCTSDEVFEFVKVNAGSRLESEDKVMLRTRKGYYITVKNSIGAVGVQPGGDSRWNISDEVFAIVRAGGNGPIKSGDAVLLRTRAGYYFTVKDSKGAIGVQSGFDARWGKGDEVFQLIFR